MSARGLLEMTCETSTSTGRFWRIGRAWTSRSQSRSFG